MNEDNSVQTRWDLDEHLHAKRSHFCCMRVYFSGGGNCDLLAVRYIPLIYIQRKLSAADWHTTIYKMTM